MSMSVEASSSQAGAIAGHRRIRPRFHAREWAHYSHEAAERKPLPQVMLQVLPQVFPHGRNEVSEPVTSRPYNRLRLRLLALADGLRPVEA